MDGAFMKRITSAAFLLAFVASPALALKVTNLDTVAHTVELSGTGAPELRIIQPNATEQFTGAAHGFLSLKTAKNPKPARGVIQADGMLSGIIGNGRTEGIPADADNSYVIWPNGKITLQGRQKYSEGR
jgi:hypothetical protein